MAKPSRFPVLTRDVGSYDSGRRKRGQSEEALQYLRDVQGILAKIERHLKSPSKPSDQRMKDGEQ